MISLLDLNRRSNNNSIIDKLRQYEYVSFDIFDTLICRNVKNPTDIFSIIEKVGVEKFGRSVSGFKNNRIEAENGARIDSKREDITLDDIYAQLISNYNEDILNWLKRKEIELELRLCTRNDDFSPIYDFCVQNKKKIVIVSDMYLPRDIIERILLDSGIDVWSNIFVSSEYGVTKNSGRLFSVAIDTLNILPSQLIHIGDNKKSDYQMARNAGLEAIRYVKTPQSLNYSFYYKQMKATEDMTAFIANTIHSVDSGERLGYQCFGPMLLGFCQWLNNELKTEGIKNVFFLSRDGLVLKKAFDITNRDIEICTHYFYASRRALRRPIISFRLTLLQFVERIKLPETVSIGFFVSLIGVQDEKIINEIQQRFDYSYTIKKQDIIYDKKFEEVYDILMNLVGEDLLDERNALIDYISQECLNGKFAIVDIGWHGNMQKDLEDILSFMGISHEVFGYYLGVDPFNNHNKSVKMKGYLFDEKKCIDLFNEEKRINSLFELIFTAPHGSVVRYTKEDIGIVKPVLSESEQTNDADSQVLWDYQCGALSFVRKAKQVSDLFLISPAVSCCAVFKQFEFPTYEDAYAWRNLVFKDESTKKLCCIDSLASYLISPRRFLSDYKNSAWKQGFLKIVFKRDLDYNKISKVITGLKKLFS